MNIIKLSLAIFAGIILSGLKLDTDQTIRIGNGAEPRELDPSTSTGVPESRIIDNLFEGLTALEPKTLSAVPGVAERWEMSNDGKTYTFYLRKNAQWSDGVPITAQTFVDSWKRAISPGLASEYSYQLFYIENAEDINKNKIKDPNKLGAKAVGKHKLVVKLRSPTPFFLRLTAFHTLYPVPMHLIKKHKGQAWTKPGILASNGPFVLKEWKLNQYIKMVPNPKYWDKGFAKIKTAYLYPIENLDSEERMFFSGKLDMTEEVPVLKIPRYLREQKANKNKYHPYRSDPFLGSYYYEFNVTKKPLNDKRVRKAIALVINRSLLVNRVTRAGEKPGYAMTPPGTAGYNPKKYLPTGANKKEHANAIRKAKKLLSAAGYPNGKGFPKVEILYNTNEKHQKVALAIQQMVKKALNINLGMYNKEWKVYLNDRKKLAHQISRAGWIGDYPDPNTFLDMFVTGGGQNNTGWSNKEYDELIRAAASTGDHKKRLEIFAKAEDILMDEMPIIPIYFYALPRLVSKNVKMQDENGKIIEYIANVQDRLFLKNLVKVR